MAFILGFQTKYVLSPWCMLFHPAKVPFKVFSILFKFHWARCVFLWCHNHRFISKMVHFKSVRSYMTQVLPSSESPVLYVVQHISLQCNIELQNSHLSESVWERILDCFGSIIFCQIWRTIYYKKRIVKSHKTKQEILYHL